VRVLALLLLFACLLQVVRLFVTIVMKRAKACAGDSQVAKLLCCCVSCCLGCVERCVRYLSRNAYVVMMIRGTAFCSSASEGLSLLTKHMVKVAVMRSVGWGFLLLGKVFISGASAAMGAYILLTQEPWSVELYSIVPAVCCIALGAWLVGSAFMGVYNMAIDTIFLCYTIDVERAKNSREHRKATPASLGKLIDEQQDELLDEPSSASQAAAASASAGGPAKRLAGRSKRFLFSEVSPTNRALDASQVSTSTRRRDDLELTGV